MKKYLLLGVMVCLLFNVNGQQPQPKKTASVEGITEYEYPNGLRVLLFPDQTKSTATVNMTYLVGSRMEGYGETGMAHLLEHMLFKGSTNHTNIPQELSSHGASPNGSTWYDRTNYFETFAATDENIDWALSLEADRMINSFVAKKDLETEFSVVRNEFESGENYPTSILQERVMSTAYIWHNYGKSTIGSKEDIEKVPIENLQAFYRKFYQPDNAVLMVSGKIDEAKTLALVSKYFGTIPRPTRKLQEPYTVEPTQDGERQVILRRVGDIQAVAAGYHIPSASHPDYIPIEILNHALINEPSGRLYKALVETKLATSVSGGVFPLRDPGYLYFDTEILKEKSIDSVKNAMLNLLDNLKSNPITKEEMDRARTSLLRDYELAFNKSDLVGTFISEFIAAGDWRLMFLYRDRIENVKLEDVNRVAVEYLKPSNRTLGLFIPEKEPSRSIIPASPDLTDTYKNYKGKAVVAEAEAFDATPANIEKRTKRGDLSGGGKYALLSKTTRGNLVKMKISLRIGSEKSLMNKGDFIDATAAMLMKGTKSLSEEQINDTLAKLSAEVGVSGGGQVVTVDISTTRDNLVNVLSIVNQILREPTFPKPEFDKMKEEILAGIDQQKSDPQAIAFSKIDQLTRVYPKADFRYTSTFDEMTEAAKKLTVEDLKKFYAEFYNSSNATVSAVGEFDETKVLAGVNSILANWTSAQKYERAADNYAKAVQKSEKIITPDKKNATMAARMNLTLKDDNADYPALVMGNYMLGGGFLNSRLATRIRQKEGISYGVGSWLRASSLDQSGEFGSYAIYNPENSTKLINAYNEELNKMITEGFTEAELKDAISGFIQSRGKNRSDDGYLVNRLNDYLNLNRTLLWDDSLDKTVSTLTPSTVNAAMKKWITPGDITIVQAGDFK
ncbi:MAG TPA: pitrilysin family protein [Bacteroidia bacterium]|nr:insulinase family protein [Bacteroidota bacterium]HQW23062.1 pitrilysin family protein [Bacteroidia bacterium]